MYKYHSYVVNTEHTTSSFVRQHLRPPPILSQRRYRSLLVVALSFTVHQVMSSDDLQERLVYDVTTSDPRVLFGLELCDVANRNPALPEFYYYNLGVHPQLRNLPRTVDTGTVYVYLVDSSPAGSIKAKSLASTIELPTGMIKPREGNNSTCSALTPVRINRLTLPAIGLGGLIDLEEGDVVFSRDIAKGGDPEEDALRIIIATRYVLTTMLPDTCSYSNES